MQYPAPLQLYHVRPYLVAMRYLNIILRNRFYRGTGAEADTGAPPNYVGLNNNWDSWATTAVLELLSPEQAAQLLRTYPPFPISVGDQPINDPFT